MRCCLCPHIARYLHGGNKAFYEFIRGDDPQGLKQEFYGRVQFYTYLLSTSAAQVSVPFGGNKVSVPFGGHFYKTV